MKFGVNLYKFPGFGCGLGPLLEFVKLAEDLGFHHVRLLDHVAGIVAERHGGIAQTPYTDKSDIREVFTLMAWLAAQTSRIELMSGVLVLPQRQTLLVAKQAAEIDIMTGGRLSLGVAVGYNALEFEAMGEDFTTRGKRFEEQVHVLRRLWCDNDVSFAGEWHTLTDVALAPRPIQRPIPLYFGMGRSIAPIPPDIVLRRVGRLADGWLPIFKPDAEGRKAVDTMEAAAREACRDPAGIVMEMSLQVADMGRDQLHDEIKRRQDFGVSRLCFGLPGASAEAHMVALDRLAQDLAGLP